MSNKLFTIYSIYCPGIEKHVSICIYVAAVKKARANPDALFPSGLTSWWPTTGREIVAQFRVGMHERISQGIPYIERGK